MEDNKNFVKEITNIDENFAQWYTDIVLKAELADYTDTKGCIAIRPYGYAIWENIQNYADRKFKETGVKNTYFPVLIPESLYKRKKNHVEGFAPRSCLGNRSRRREIRRKIMCKTNIRNDIYNNVFKMVKNHGETYHSYIINGVVY